LAVVQLLHGRYIITVELFGWRQSTRLLQVNAEATELLVTTEQSRARCGVCLRPLASATVGAPCPRCHGAAAAWRGPGAGVSPGVCAEPADVAGGGDGGAVVERDPAGDGYGSIRFHAEVMGSQDIDRHDHSHYYDMGSESLRSLTDISSGHSGQLQQDGLIADGRRQPHIGPFRVPGIPAFIDPEHDRPRPTIQNDHQYLGYRPR